MRYLQADLPLGAYARRVTDYLVHWAETTPDHQLSQLTVRWAPDDDGTFKRLIVERKDGTLEYWALRHAAAQPDFHARDTFVLTLATATHKAD